MKRLAIGVFLAGITATSAFAGGGKYHETAVPPPLSAPAPMVTGFDWTGGYLGAQIGYGNVSYSDFSSQSGGAGGIFGGYRLDMGTSVVGIEGELNPVTFKTYNIPTGDQLKTGAALHVSYGMKLTQDERTLLSIKAGPSMVRTSIGGSSDTAFGLSGGIDIDHMLTDNIMLRGGLRAAATNSLGSQDLNARSIGASAGLGLKF